MSLLLKSHRLVNDATDGIRRLPLHPLGGVGVGVQREARAVVAQRVGEGLHIHSILEGQRGEGMSEVMKPNVFDARSGQNLFVSVPERVRVVHCPRLRRGEHIRAVRVLFML